MITGSIVGVAYITGYLSLGILVLSMSSAFLNRATGPYWWAYLMMMSCNVYLHSLCGLKLRTVLLFFFVIHCC
jgi:molybdopterin-containing oxidoreductase family membrane subunit